MMLACGADAPTSGPRGELVAQVAGTPLFQEQIDAVAERDGLDADAAKATAIDTIRLQAARKEELGDRGAELAPERAAHLHDSALARTYLRTVFEPEHGPAQVSDGFLRANLTNPQRAGRWFHPKLHALCQVIVMPKQSDEKDAKPVLAPEDDEAWWTEARAMMTRLSTRLRAYEKDFAGEENCTLIQTTVGSGKQANESGEIMVKTEAGMFHVARPNTWSKRWVENMTTATAGAWVGPFETEFGLHFVFVLKIMEDTAVSPFDADEEERIAKQREAFREVGLDQWRATEAFPNHLRDLRERHLVRVAGAGQPMGTAAN